MGTVFYFGWEMELIKWMQSLECPFLNALSSGAAMLGEEFFLLLLIGTCYWSINKDLGRKISMTLVGSMMVGSMLKCIILRIRPYMVDSKIKCLHAPHPDEDAMSVQAQGYSFPSLHSAMSVSTYTTIAVNVRKRLFIILAVLLPLLIGVTRVYLGVHYPTDVLVGWLLGLGATALLLAAEGKWGYKIAFLIILILGFPGLFYCNENDFFTCYGITLGLFLGFVFEEKKVNFEMPKTTAAKILRPVLGFLLFFIAGTILKLPVSKLDPAVHQTFLFFYRMFRYCLSAFIIIGLYPMTFKIKR